MTRLTLNMDDCSGFTLFELIAVLSLITILSVTAIYNLRSMSHPLNNAGFSVEHFLRYARSRAITSTEVVKVNVVCSGRLQAYSSDSCAGTLTPLADLSLDLPSGAMFTDSTASVCFTQRGFALTSASFPLTDTEGFDKTVKVAIGGGTKID